MLPLLSIRHSPPTSVARWVIDTSPGLLILYLVNQQTDSALVLSFSLYFIALGATWVFIGLRRRRAALAG